MCVAWRPCAARIQRLRDALLADNAQNEVLGRILSSRETDTGRLRP
jgi:hypothetical protein